MDGIYLQKAHATYRFENVNFDRGLIRGMMKALSGQHHIAGHLDRNLICHSLKIPYRWILVQNKRSGLVKIYLLCDSANAGGLHAAPFNNDGRSTKIIKSLH